MRYIVNAPPAKEEGHQRYNWWDIIDTTRLPEGDAKIISASANIPGVEKWIELACLALNTTGFLS